MSRSKMLQEILQQPEVLERTLDAELPAATELRRRFEKKKPRLVVLVARGSSDNAGQFARYLLEITTGIPVSLSAPSIFTLYGSQVDLKDTLVVGISQSGESTDVNFVLKQAKRDGAMTIGITNEASSTLAGIAEHVLLVRAGTEQSVAATKTYTGQLLIMYLLAYALGARLTPGELRRLPQWTRAALRLESEIRERAERYRFMEHAVVVGRGLNYANALEFALKLMETCYVVAERFSSADFLHGPIAMIEAAFPVFMFGPPGVTWPGTAELALRLSKIAAETFIITDQSNSSASQTAVAGPLAKRLLIPAKVTAKTGPCDLFTPIPYIVPAQLFAAQLADVKGFDPDHPRALKKVTHTL